MTRTTTDDSDEITGLEAAHRHGIPRHWCQRWHEAGKLERVGRKLVHGLSYAYTYRAADVARLVELARKGTVV